MAMCATQTACTCPGQGEAPQAQTSPMIPSTARQNTDIFQYYSLLCVCSSCLSKTHFPRYFSFLNSFYRCQYSRKHRLQKNSSCQRQLKKNCITHARDGSSLFVGFVRSVSSKNTVSGVFVSLILYFLFQTTSVLFL